MGINIRNNHIVIDGNGFLEILDENQVIAKQVEPLSIVAVKLNKDKVG